MINFFIDRPKLGVLLSLIVILAGVLGAKQLRREAFPSVNFAQAQIVTVYPGATPEDVEELVTQKIEDEIRGTSGLKLVQSVSTQGLSTIFVHIDLDYSDVTGAMTELQRSVDRVTDLPAEVEERPRFLEIKTRNIPILEVSLHGDAPEMTIRQWMDRLEDRLERLPGVATIRKVGYRDREYRILLNAQALQQHHVSVEEVVAAVRAHNVDLPGGSLVSTPHQVNVRTSNEIESVAALADVVVRANLSGQQVRIRDLGEVVDSFRDPTVLARTNGKRSMVATITKQESADIVRLATSVRETIAAFAKGLPSGVNVTLSNDEARRTEHRLDIVTTNTWIGLILVLISLLVFLNWQTAIVTSLSMPLVVLGTMACMLYVGITFNLISMLAIIIALGMFVDNSIVVSENIYRYREEGYSLVEATRRGVNNIFWPVTATVLTTIAAFAPMGVTAGIMGKFIWGIPVVVSISLLMCLAESFILLPTRVRLADVGVRRAASESHWFVALRRWFDRQLDAALRHQWRSLGVALGLLILSFVWAGTKMDFILFPPEGIDIMVVRYEAEPGTSVEQLDGAVREIESHIAALPPEELDSFVTRTGIQQVDISDPNARNADNVGMIVVYLTPENKRVRLAKEIEKSLVESIPVQAPLTRLTIEKMVMGPPVGKAVTITVLGNNLETLKKGVSEIVEYLGGVDGVKNITTNDRPGPQDVHVRVRTDAQQLYGIAPQDVARTLRAAYEGVEASTVTQFGDEIGLRVQLADADRGDLSVLSALTVRNARGNLVPLQSIADITKTDGTRDRHHQDFLRSITVTADVDIDIVTSSTVNAKLAKHFADFTKRYPDYRLKYGGEEESTRESMDSLFAAMIIAVLCIYGILVTLFNSLAKPLLVMFSIPFGFIGTIVGFTLQDKPLGFFAMIGVVGLAGVVVNASIVMVSFIDELRADGVPFGEALRRGASLRLRPILLTTVTTVAALVPTAYGIGGWDPILVPMTMALAWGLLFGTTLTLFLVPCGYAALESVQTKLSLQMKRVKGQSPRT